MVGPIGAIMNRLGERQAYYKALFVVIGGLLLHVQILELLNTPVTVAWLASVLFVCGSFLWRFRMSVGAMVYFIIFCAAPLITLLLSQKYYSFDFIKSYLLYLFFGVYFLCVASNRALLHENVYSFAPLISMFGVIYAIATIAQCVAFNFFDTHSLSVILGPFQRVGPGGVPYEPLASAPIKKSSGFLSEPSVAAWVHAAFLSIVFSLKERGARPALANASMLLSALAMLATLSFSGILNVFIIGIAILWVKRNLRLLASSIIVVAISVPAVSSIGFGEHAQSRIDRVGEQGNSLYYRVVAPVMLMSDSLKSYPIGLPLGDTRFIENKSYMVNSEGGSNTNLDNFASLIIYHFGYVGIIFVFCWIAKVLLALRARKKGALGYVSITLIGLETGSLWSPATFSLIGLIVVACIPPYSKVR